MSYEINEITSYENDVDLSDILCDELTNDLSTIKDDWSCEYIKLQLYYTENYTLKDLNKMCDYYKIDKRKKRKDDLIEDIIIFENSPDNINIVKNRKKLWSYIEELKNDTYFKKYVIWD